MEFVRDEEKYLLVRNRPGGGGVGFEDVANVIMSGMKAKKLQNDSENYAHQGMFIVDVNGYPYKVPFRELSDDRYYLVTIYPSRKHKAYL